MRLREMTALTTGLLAMTAMAGSLVGALRADNVDDYLKAEMAHRHIPGMTVAVVQDGKVVKYQGYGLADMELSVPATPDTVYLLASISKQFTAAGILLLVRDGKVGLDDAVGKYLNGLPQAWRGVTVRQLLNQTSGIPEWVPDPDKDPLLKTYTLREIAQRAAVNPLAFTPGTRFQYSNTNYSLLAGIIEKADGRPYGEFLRARIFKPLGMDATGVYDPSEIVTNRAAGYVRSDGKLFNNTLVYDPSLLAGAGGLQSTAGDLVKWDAALAAGTLLPAASLAQMGTPPALPGGARSGYGMGWVSQTINGHRLLWHNGSLPGAMSFLGRFPDDHLTVILLSNMSPLDGFDDAFPFLPLGQGLAALYLPALAPAKADPLVPDMPPQVTTPQVTQTLRQVLTDLAAGKADTAYLTPAMSAALTPAVIAQTDRNLASAGAFKPDSLALMSRADKNGLRVYRYRALYGETPIIWTVHLTKDGKIAGLIPQGE
jgi:D-alanyl-D-alanine carboxypeptidase